MAKNSNQAQPALGLFAEQDSLWTQDVRAGAGWIAGSGSADAVAPGQAGPAAAPVRTVQPVLMPAAAPDAPDFALKPGDAFHAKPEPAGSGAQSSGPVVMAPDLPTDPLFANQYHLRNTAGGQRDLAMFRGDTGVWDEYTGAGVLVGVIDDGIDKLHVDLDGNYNAALETIDGSHPSALDAHGTSTSGLIAAERNGVGVVGVAYDAKITMMAAISQAPNISLEASLDNAKNFDVINNSWGFTSPWFDEFFNAPQTTYYAELNDITLSGRGGLGSVFVKSAGNGRDDSYTDNSNLSFTNGHWGNVTVAAVLRTGFVSSYSSEGAANLVSAFGGPIPGDVFTTDRTGAPGYEVGDNATQFNGTSAAAPMVSGIVALMLEANPELGYRDVQDILAMTARHTGSAIGGGIAGAERYLWEFNGSTLWNGGGMHFSEDYGFGLVDALAAVRVAESWTDQRTRANLVQTTPTSTSFTTPIAIADNANFNVTFTLPAGTTVEHVLMDLGLNHTFTADLDITLTSPDGTVSELLRDNGGSFDVPNYPHVSGYDVTLMSNMFRGEDSGGVWTLNIADDLGGDTGTLSKVSFYIEGRNNTDDTHVLTEEYSVFANAARQTIEDTNGGVDTLNAAAVFTSSFIDLAGGGSTVDGVLFNTDGNIENAVGGDGADTLLGSGAANALSGYRGKDSLSGLGGADTLDGGGAADNLIGGGQNDLVLGGLGPDVMSGGSGVDTLDYSVLIGEAFIDLGLAIAQNTHSGGNDVLQGFENVITGDGDDRVVGAGAANSITTGAGIDTVKSGGGADSIFGGDGADKLKGGGDADYIQGGKGADQLRGGFGADVFDYNATNHSGPGAAGDAIQDFSTAEGDKIDLADVVAGLLSFIGGAAVSGGGAHQVRVQAVTGGQLVQVDVNGDAVSDMDILVQNSGLAGGGGDFVL